MYGNLKIVFKNISSIKAPYTQQPPAESRWVEGTD